MEEYAFALLVEPHRRALHLHCYRMLGSLHDADDALQETMLRAWKGSDRFEPRAQFTTWLHAIATNVCLTAIARRRTRPTQVTEDLIYLEPYPDTLLDDLVERETVALAFITAIQLLPPKQRAVLILRDVLGFSGEEVAESLETTPKAVYSALQRAHKTVERQLPVLSQQQTLSSLGDARVREIVETYVDAWERGDVDVVVSMLAEEAILAMPPRPSWYLGLDAARTFLARGPLGPTVSRRAHRVHANGQVAVGVVYFAYPGEPETLPVLQLLTLDPNGRIADVTAFIGTNLEPFGLSSPFPV